MFFLYETSLFASDGGNSFVDICRTLDCEDETPAWPDSFGKAINNWLKDNRIPTIRTLSLFSGAGGLDIGFSDIGFEIVESVEIEKKFCETLELNTGKGKYFPKTITNCIDIRKYSAEHLGEIDFIIGGPPCQTFSAAGRRANGVLGTKDERGILFKEYVRILKELSPRGFLFENVYGIIGAQKGAAWAEIIKAFSEIGYHLYYRILDAADYGVPQHRERLIIVGLKDGTFRFPRPTHGPDSLDGQPFYNAEMAIAGVVSEESIESNKLGGRFGHLLNDIPPGLNYSFYTEKMGHPKPLFAWRSKFSDFLYKADPNVPVRTIKASGGAYTGPLHWDNRFFYYEEYKRLQTFPDEYKISGSKAIAVKQIGNSVPPQLARMLAISIRNQVFDTEFPFKLSLLDEGEELSFRKRKRMLTSLYREKARNAILKMEKQPLILPSSKAYYCNMESSFRFVISDKSNGAFKVIIDWTNILSVKVYDDTNSGESPLSKIVVKSTLDDWSIGVGTVELILFSNKPEAYTIAWKAFEKELIDNSIKADLVQLNGYYQYEPKIIIDAKIATDFPYSHILEKILTSKCVPQFKNSYSLATEWGVGINEVIEVAKFLRLLGYEIRNHSTNPQIPQGEWLIPYVFPTLTPLSVQLFKQL